MSDVDALLWTIEKDPLLRSTITTVCLLDEPPEPHRLAQKIERASIVVPRLRQRVIGIPAALAPPRWELDPRFDIGYHVRFLRAPGEGEGTLGSVLDVAQWAAMQGFDRARPLWELYVVDGLAEGAAALIQKVHHSITDGIGGMRMALALFDSEREPGPLGPTPEPPPDRVLGAPERLAEALGYLGRRQLRIARTLPATALRAAGRAVGDPRGATRSVWSTTASASRLLAPSRAHSPLLAGRSLNYRFAAISRPFEDLRRAAKAADSRLNDAFVAAVAGGLRSYHLEHGATTATLRMTMPINLRAGTTSAIAGNRFAPARFTIPLDVADPVERMGVIRDLVAAQRAEPALGLLDPLAAALRRLPATLTTALMGTMLKGVDLVASNVPGSPFPLYLAGARIVQQFPFGPLSGAAMNILLLSWGPDACVGVNVDAAAVPDVAALARHLEYGFDEILAVG